MKRTLRHFVFALLGFASAAALIHHLVPEPYRGDVSDKLAWFEEHGDEVDVLFFGSSRIHRGVIPSVFDREMARHGHPVRSFNFGVLGMGMHETSALVRRVLAMEPARLRRVVVELDGWSAAIRPQNRFKKRMVSWHDPAETASALRTVALSGAGRLERLEQTWTHLLHLGAWTTGAGRGRYLVEDLARDGRPRRSADLSEARGFEPFSESAYGTPSTHPFRRRFVRMIPVYRKAVARLAAANGADVSLEGFNRRAVEEQVALIRRAGAEPVHLITPTARPTPELYRLAATGAVPQMLAFNDPERYPDLFTVDRRFDAEHLTTEGAERFTRLLAERCAALWSGEGSPDGPGPGDEDPVRVAETG